MSSVTAKPKPKPADDERLRDAWITLPIVMAFHRDRDRGRYYLATRENMRDNQMYDMHMRGPERREREYEFFSIDMRVRPEAVTGVSKSDGPDRAIVFINGVQHTCRMSPKAIWELLL